MVSPLTRWTTDETPVQKKETHWVENMEEKDAIAQPVSTLLFLWHCVPSTQSLSIRHMKCQVCMLVRLTCTTKYKAIKSLKTDFWIVSIAQSGYGKNFACARAETGGFKTAPGPHPSVPIRAFLTTPIWWKRLLRTATERNGMGGSRLKHIFEAWRGGKGRFSGPGHSVNSGFDPGSHISPKEVTEKTPIAALCAIWPCKRESWIGMRSKWKRDHLFQVLLWGRSVGAIRARSIIGRSRLMNLKKRLCAIRELEDNWTDLLPVYFVLPIDCVQYFSSVALWEIWKCISFSLE